MTYISSEDARRFNSEELADGFPTPVDELFTCTCHGKRWPLSMLRMEDGGKRHCPNQANVQGGTIDRDMIRDRERIELQRRATDDARPVKWPVMPLEDVAIIHTIEPNPCTVPVGGRNKVLIRGLYLSSLDVIAFSLTNVTLYTVVYSADGTLCTLTVNGLIGRADVNLFYNGSEYDGVFEVRLKGEGTMPQPVNNYTMDTDALVNGQHQLSSQTVNLATDAGLDAVRGYVFEMAQMNATTVSISLTKQP